MKINYKLSYSDFLQYHLYNSSKSKLHKKSRFRSRIIIPIIYLILGYLLVNENIRIGIVFVGIAILWFAFFPMYSKWKYKRYLRKHIEENYKNKIDKLVEIVIDGNSIIINDYAAESKLNGAELKELIETKENYFIKLTTDTSLTIPKHSIENQMEFKKRVTQLGAKYVDELNWEC